MSGARLVDTNILVYRYDYRFPRKRAIATRVLREGIKRDDLRVPHQAIIEFVAATIKPLGKSGALLTRENALREAEELLACFTILYPDETLIRTALRGMVAYQLSWFDAHLWAYAECFGLDEILSEDFEHNRCYGRVKIVNPFI